MAVARVGAAMTAKVFLVALLLAACSREDMVADAQHKARNLVYTKDHRTGLCFAIWEASTGYRAGISEVPCDKVEGLLDQ